MANCDVKEILTKLYGEGSPESNHYALTKFLETLKETGEEYKRKKAELGVESFQSVYEQKKKFRLGIEGTSGNARVNQILGHDQSESYTNDEVYSVELDPDKKIEATSGGAAGSDTVWGEGLERLGGSVKHFYIKVPDSIPDDAEKDAKGNLKGSTPVPPNANTPIAWNESHNLGKDGSNLFLEGRIMAAEAMKNIFGYDLPFVSNFLIVRNWAQIKDSDGVFAISSFAEEGSYEWGQKLKKNSKTEENRKYLKESVVGGTGYAVEMGIIAGKPVYVYNQKGIKGKPEGWYKYDYDAGKFVKTEKNPTLGNKPALIGARESTKKNSGGLTANGKRAINSILSKTLESKAAANSSTVTEILKIINAPHVANKTFVSTGKEDLYIGNAVKKTDIPAGVTIDGKIDSFTNFGNPFLPSSMKDPDLTGNTANRVIVKEDGTETSELDTLKMYAEWLVKGTIPEGYPTDETSLDMLKFKREFIIANLGAINSVLKLKVTSRDIKNTGSALTQPQILVAVAHKSSSIYDPSKLETSAGKTAFDIAAEKNAENSDDAFNADTSAPVSGERFGNTNDMNEESGGYFISMFVANTKGKKKKTAAAFIKQVNWYRRCIGKEPGFVRIIFVNLFKQLYF